MSVALQTALLQRPRPWRIVGDSVVEDANGQEVCTVDTQRNLADGDALALAQLIAAPEAPAEGAGEGCLLPCPFCGGDAEIVHIEEGENEDGSCVCCTVCQASGNVEFGRKENFVSNWNRRTRSYAPEAREVKPVAEPEWQSEAFAFLYGLLGGEPHVAANVLRLNPEVRARLHRAIYDRKPRDEPYDDMMARLCPNGLPTAAPSAETLRDEVLEEAANICEDITSWGLSPTKAEVAKSTQTFCAKAIRAQKSEDAQP